MRNKLIIISGGMDSVTLLHREEKNIKMALSFYYGQKHMKELNFAVINCRFFGIPHQRVDISTLLPLLKSDLLQTGGDIPEGHYEDISMKRTVVPFRNGMMLSIAAGIAESNGCASILIGSHAGDHAIYPDCRSEFIFYMSQAIKLGTYAEVKIESPFVTLSKREIALLGKEIGVDYSQTWSCYKGGKVHCGKCGTCVERREALEGFDPTVYEENK